MFRIFTQTVYVFGMIMSLKTTYSGSICINLIRLIVGVSMIISEGLGLHSGESECKALRGVALWIAQS